MLIDPATIRNSWTRFTRDAIDFIYARSCVRCRDPLPHPEESFRAGPGAADLRFCPGCYELLSCAVEQTCQRCGAPVGPYLDTTHGCRYCRRDRFQFDRVFALGVYEHALRECCVRAKQSSEEPLAAALTELLADAHAEEWAQLAIDLIVPVPHHWSQRLSQGELPPVTMCTVLARRLKVPAALHILAKPRRTPQQKSLTPKRRRANLRGAFRTAGGARLDGLAVLLTDDILTTGTTADRAAQVLKAAGAKQVFVAVLARGLGRPHLC
ncbi:MAG: ComF family protein [Planctomycetaceae bacterium]